MTRLHPGSHHLRPSEPGPGSDPRQRPPAFFGAPKVAGLLAATLALLAAATPSAAREPESLLTRALSCQIGDGAVAKLMDTLAIEDAGLKSPAQSLAAPSGNLYRLAKPVSALGYSAREVYVSPGRIAMAVAGQTPASVAARLKLEPDAYGPAERAIDGAHKIIAYELHQDALAGKVLVGCEYGDPAAQAWLAPDSGGF
jgi:hypothetical protein